MPTETNVKDPASSGTLSLNDTILRGSDGSVLDDGGGNLKTSLGNLARTQDTISAATATDAIMVGTTPVTPQFAKIAVSASGENALINHSGTSRIRVIAAQFGPSVTATVVKFQSSTTDATGGSLTDETGAFTSGLSIPTVLPYNPAGWFQTNAGEALHINLSAANAIGGAIVYILV